QWEYFGASSETKPGAGGAAPLEWFQYTIPPGQSGTYGLLIQRISPSGTNILDLSAFVESSFNPFVRDRSLVDPATASGAFSVAAVFETAPEPDQEFRRLPSSSVGPAHPPNNDWWPLPGNGNAQPRISAYSNVSTAIRPGFSGTSAAAPHVAGAAALVMDRFDDYSAEQVRLLLETRAIDMVSSLPPVFGAGYDFYTGMGRLWLGDPHSDPTPTPTNTPDPTNTHTPTHTLTPPGNDLISNATVVGNPSTTVMDPTGSTVSAGDPPACAPYTNNVWFRYTSPIDQPITFTTQGSSYDTVLAVYTGIPAALTPLACDDDSGTTTRSWLGMYVSAGTTYYIMVGKYGATPLSGPATLSFNVSPVPTGDTLALFNPTGGLTSLVDTLQDQPPLTSYTTFTDNTPVNTP